MWGRCTWSLCNTDHPGFRSLAWVLELGRRDQSRQTYRQAKLCLIHEPGIGSLGVYLWVSVGPQASEDHHFLFIGAFLIAKQGPLRERSPHLFPLSPRGTIGLLLRLQWSFCIEQIPPLVSLHNSLKTRLGGRESVSCAARTTFIGTGTQRAVSPGRGLGSR